MAANEEVRTQSPIFGYAALFEVTESAPPADTQLSTQAGLELAEIVSA